MTKEEEKVFDDLYDTITKLAGEPKWVWERKFVCEKDRTIIPNTLDFGSKYSKEYGPIYDAYLDFGRSNFLQQVFIEKVQFADESDEPINSDTSKYADFILEFERKCYYNVRVVEEE